jgi:hypothetical protein
MPSKRDTILAALRGSGYTGTIADAERKRLLAALALPPETKKSLADLYKLKGEKPRIGL